VSASRSEPFQTQSLNMVSTTFNKNLNSLN